MSEPAGIVAAAMPWTRILNHIAIAGFVLALVLAVVRHVAGLPWPFRYILAGLLFSFGSLKLAVACDAWRRLTDPTARPDPAATHGSRRAVSAWILYKFTAAFMAYGAVLYVLTVGAARTEQIFGG